MSLSLSSNAFSIQPTTHEALRTRFSSQFISPIPVSSRTHAFSVSHVNSPSFFEFSRERLDPITASAASAAETAPLFFQEQNPQGINVLVVGSTGYIRKFVVRELVNRGFNVMAVARERSGIRGRNSKDETLDELKGANVCFSGGTNLETLEKFLEGLGGDIDVVESCLASPSFVKGRWWSKMHHYSLIVRIL